MNLNVCLIDDALLDIEKVDKIFTEYQIQTSLEMLAPEDDNPQEHEINLKQFIKSLTEDSNITLHGYTSPVTFNNRNQHPFDVIIYDWEYGPTGQLFDSKEELEKLLENTYCFIYIYSHMDDQNTISKIEEIQNLYKNRIEFLKKGETNSASELMIKIASLKIDNFSAKFAKQLRINASKSVEKILVRLSHLNIKKFHEMMGTNNEEKKKDLVEFISEKFKNEMMQMEFSIPEHTGENIDESSIDVSNTEQEHQEPSIDELWHYRMYSTVNDERVRKGDIYKNSDDEYILIMTPNCQLVMYHENKTFGILNYCKLVNTSNLKDTVERLVLHEGNASSKNTCIGRDPKNVTSLINQIGSKESAPFILPYVELNTTNLILFPKMYSFMEIQVKNQKAYLNKNEIDGFEYVTTLSEPFLSELIKEIYDKLERNGVPNFSTQVQDEINSILLGSFSS